jgi:hypothetical protein
MAKSPRRRSRLGIFALIGLALFMGLVVWRSLQIGGVRCEVCISYGGRSQCRTVDGQTRDEAMMAATTNACAFLASGVTDGIACGRTEPTKADCTELGG